MPRRSGRPDVQACRGGCARRENQTSSWKPKAHPGRPRAKPISRSRRRFFLSRQSWLAELALDRAQEGLRVATEAAAQDAGSTPLLEAVADLAPPAPIGRGEVARLATAEPGERRRDEPHRAAQHQAGRGRLAAGRPPLVAAVRPEQP